MKFKQKVHQNRKRKLYGRKRDRGKKTTAPPPSGPSWFSGLMAEEPRIGARPTLFGLLNRRPHA